MNKIIVQVLAEDVDAVLSSIFGVDILLVEDEFYNNDNSTTGWADYYPRVLTAPWGTTV